MSDTDNTNEDFEDIPNDICINLKKLRLFNLRISDRAIESKYTPPKVIPHIIII